MYDMAHVLGLLGPYFQEPFKEGADFVTGSTHKTYFGTQREVIGCDFKRHDKHYELWEAIERRAFPGSVSNHHLGILLGLLMAAYEINHFKDKYQKKIVSNTKAFTMALKETGLDIAGEPDISYTETHQVIIKVGYAKGPEMANSLGNNNIIVNYQASPEEEGFTASGALRTGVQEIIRVGMETEDFQILAQLFHDVLVDNKNVKEKVKAFRQKFLGMKYCFSGGELDDLLGKLNY